MALREPGRQVGQDHRLLLGALLLPLEEAADRLRVWRSHVDLDDVDTDSFALLPRLVARLDALGSDHADDARIRGVARQTWTRNELLLARTEPVVEALADRLTSPVLIGDLARSTTLGWSSDQRLLGGISLLLAPDDLDGAASALGSFGWVAAGPGPAAAGSWRSLHWRTDFRSERFVISIHRGPIPNVGSASFGRGVRERAIGQPGWASTHPVSKPDLLVSSALVGDGARWAYELAELVASCSRDELDGALATADERGLGGVVVDRLRTAGALLPDSPPATALADLAGRNRLVSPAWRCTEDRLLRSPRRRTRALVAGLAAIDGAVSQRRRIGAG